MIASNDPGEMRSAADLLVQIGGADAFDRLVPLLNSPNTGVRDAAERAITMLGGRMAIEKMAPFLASENPQLRNIAIDVLRKTGEDGLDILHRLTTDQDDHIRLFTVDILGSIGNAQSMEPLINTLHDENANVRNAAVVSLGKIGDPEAFEPLKELTNDEEWIRFAVIEAMAQIPHDGITAFLLEELKRWTSDEITTSAIIETLGEIRSQGAVEPLLKMIDTSTSYIQMSIAQAVIKILGPDGIASLDNNNLKSIRFILGAHLLESGEEDCRDMLSLLAMIGNDSSIDPIIKLSEITDPDIDPETWDAIKDALAGINNPGKMIKLFDLDEKRCILGTEILGRIGKEKEAEKITMRIFSSDGYIKRAMALALLQIASPESRETFIRLLHDNDGHVISYAVNAIGKIGTVNDIDELIPFLSHQYPDIRDAALDAIAKIDTPKASEIFNGLLNDQSPQKRCMGIAGLEQIRDKELEKSLSYMVQDKDDQVRITAIQAAKRTKTHLKEDLLLILLTDKNYEIRYKAIDIAGEERIEACREGLEAALKDPDMWLAYHAIEALGKFCDEREKETLLSILSGNNAFLRIGAAKALGNWEEDEALADELEVYTDDDNLDIVRAVVQTIDRLRGDAF